MKNIALICSLLLMGCQEPPEPRPIHTHEPPSPSGFDGDYTKLHDVKRGITCLVSLDWQSGTTYSTDNVVCMKDERYRLLHH
jgi:hypothetical protein